MIVTIVGREPRTDRGQGHRADTRAIYRCAATRAAAVGAALIVACGQPRHDAAATSSGSQTSAMPANGPRDPCGLVTRQEAEVYLGPLEHDPYRSSPDLKADPAGESCAYRAPTGQSIVITPNWTNGKMVMKLNAMGAKMASIVLPDASGNADTLGGEWDDISWTSPGDLFVLKGDVSLDVDVSGSRAGVVGAAKVADDAFPRVDKPLAYDGSKPSLDAPGPVVATREPCSVFPRKDVEAVLGPLTGDPVNQGTACVFNLPRNSMFLSYVSVEVQWSGGFKRMSRELWAARDATGGFAAKITPGGGGTDAMRADTGVQKQIGRMDARTGAKVNQDAIFLKTDTTGQPKGPWDEAAVVAGGEFAAVRKDVYMAVDLRLFPVEKARSLVTIGMSQF